MTVKVTIKNDENITSPHKIIVGVLDEMSENFVEKHTLEPTEEVSINIYGLRTIVISELPPASKINFGGAPVDPGNVAFISNQNHKETSIAASQLN